MDENNILKDILNSMGFLEDKKEEDEIKTIAHLLSLSDDNFKIISEIFLDEFEKNLKNENKAHLDEFKQLFENNSINVSQVSSFLDEFNKAIDNELTQFSSIKRDFIKRIMAMMYNAILEGQDEKNIFIPIKLCNKDAKMPSYANDTDAGMDVYALEDITVNPGETVLVKTGLKVAIPVGYELQVRPKSGRALKTKLRIANTPGTIDSGYRDEIGVIIENIEHPIQDIEYEFDENGTPIIKSILHGKSYTINKGEKFAQLVLNEVPHVVFYEVKNINEIEGDRGGGFGSTGLK